MKLTWKKGNVMNSFEKNKALNKWVQAHIDVKIISRDIETLAMSLQTRCGYCKIYDCADCPMLTEKGSCTVDGHPFSVAHEHLALALIAMKELEVMISEDINK